MNGNQSPTDPKHQRSLLRQVAIPAEHGGWSLTIEPVLLGLIVGWSPSGLALGLAAILAFMARTPLKLVLVDRWRGRWLARTTVAARVAMIEIALIVALAVLAVVGASGRFWPPLVAAAGLVGIELWFDMRSRSRRLVPELAGAIGIGSVAAAIVLANAMRPSLALGLWVLIAARSVAAITFVRVQLARAKGQSSSVLISDIGQAVGVAGVVIVCALGWVPIAGLVAVSALSIFHLVSVRLAPKPAVVLGALQTALGLIVVVVAGLTAA